MSFTKMKKSLLCVCSFLSFFYLSFLVRGANNPETLPIGAKAPDFNLPGIDGKNYTLASFNKAKVLVIAFICNHCPTSQAYEDRLIRLTSDYADKGVQVVAINPNNPGSLQYYELGWSDVDDSFSSMKIRAKDRHFNFPYLYDGETETASKLYGPVATPHLFIFDQDRILRYEGRVDDTEDPGKTPQSQDARNAIEAILNGKPVPVTTTKVFGCSIKWLEKNDWLEKSEARWAKEPVSLDSLGLAGVEDLVKNSSPRLRLINVWSTSCPDCATSFPGFVTLAHIYEERDFDFVSLNADGLANQAYTLNFLKDKHSSGTNYFFTGDPKDLAQAVNPAWTGALPYTILIEPGGKIVYAKQGIINEEELRKIIFNDPLIGRLYK